MLWWSDVIMSMFEVFLDDIDLTEQKKFIHTLSRRMM